MHLFACLLFNFAVCLFVLVVWLWLVCVCFVVVIMGCCVCVCVLCWFTVLVCYFNKDFS